MTTPDIHALPKPTVAVRALQKKYSYTLGEIEKLENAEYEWVGVEGYALAEQYWRERLKTLNTTLAALERSIRMFDPKWLAKSTMKACSAWKQRPLARSGEFTGALVRILSNASEPILTSDIAILIAGELRIPISRRDQRQRLYQMAYQRLRSARDRGDVVSSGLPNKWSLARSTNQAERG
jgi:hypothetical protein